MSDLEKMFAFEKSRFGSFKTAFFIFFLLFSKARFWIEKHFTESNLEMKIYNLSDFEVKNYNSSDLEV